MKRWQKMSLLGAVVPVGLLGLSCCVPGFGLRPSDGVLVRQFGDEVLVTDDEGSLSSLRPTDDQGRLDAMKQYLKENRDAFGAGDVDPNALEFTSAIPQIVAERSDGASFAMVALQQTYMGAAIVDEFQYGAFRRDDGGDLLQRVRGHLRNPMDLPLPPPTDGETMRVAQDTAASFAMDRGFGADDWSLHDMPVISVRLGVAGFLMRRFKANEDGSFSSFTAIVDPATENVWVLADQTACQSGKPFNGG